MSKNPSKKDLEAQVLELTESLKRERADADNIRKRAATDQVDAIIRGQEIAVEKLLPLIDSLERAFAHTPKEIADNTWVQGVTGLEKQLAKLTAEFGLERINTVGEQFDPERMQAVVADDSEGESDIVTEELQSGYILNGKVIRVAMVKVRS